MASEVPEVGQQPDPVGGSHPDGAQIVVPSRQQLTILRGEARADGTLHDLRERLAALFSVGQRFGVVHSELVRLAVARLEVERDIGNQLGEGLRRGRPQKRSPRVTFSGARLPEGMTKQQAMRFRDLARVPEALFQSYLELVASEGRLPTSSGARRFAARSEPRARPRRGVRSKVVLAPDVLAALGRMMVPDVLVGPALVPAGKVVAPDQPRVLEELRGAVLVLECPDPQAWFEAAVDLVVQRLATRVVLVLPLEVHSSWYSKVVERWLPCWVPPRSDIGGRPLVVVDIRG